MSRTWFHMSLMWALLLSTMASLAAEPADLVLFNGKLVTMDDRGTVAEALAIRHDRILAVGSDTEISGWMGDSTRSIDLRQQLTLPGFIEGHGHFVGLGQSKLMLNLRSAKTWNEVVGQVERAARSIAPGDWIVGRGWHQEKWTEVPSPHVDGYPIHAALSEVSPDNPVLLTHASGHMGIANAKAMDMAGVNASTADPDGGEIVKDGDGRPTGVLRETAQGLITRAKAASESVSTPEQRRRRIQKWIGVATQECLANGVTSFQDAGSSLETIDAFRGLADTGELRVRLWIMVRDDNDRLARQLGGYRMIGYGSNFLTVRAIKRSIDGALGPHGAWLLSAYDDRSNSTGLNTSTIQSISRTANIAVEHDFQLCVHAIGDRANRETLSIFERTFRKFPRDDQRRWRIEHAQHLHPEDIPRFARLGVIASMQGIHCTSDAIYVVQRLGQRRASEGAYVWRDLLDAGAIIVNGTDAPVENISPIECFYASVTRKLSSGISFFPEQCMSREEALKSYTSSAAFAAFEDDIKGSLEPGKLADIVVLSQDLLTCPESEILKTKIVHTFVGGQLQYSAAKPD